MTKWVLEKRSMTQYYSSLVCSQYQVMASNEGLTAEEFLFSPYRDLGGGVYQRADARRRVSLSA